MTAKKTDSSEELKARLEAALEYGIDLKGRRIFLHGDVGEDTIGVAIRGMYLLAEENKEPIEVIVSSYGGNLDESFALHDVTRTIKVPVITCALGKCQSAAPLLVACGQKGERYASENTSFMLHDAQLEFGDGDADYPANIMASARVTAAMMDTYARLMARYTKKDKRFWTRIFAGKVDRFFTAEEALEWGVIDQIWSEKD